MSARDDAVIAFISAAAPDDAFAVAALAGREAISAPFSFALDLLSESDDLDLDALLEADARLGLRESGPDEPARWRWRHGVLARVERHDGGGRWTSYHATFVPRLWRASLTRRSRVVLDRSVLDIAEAVLGENGLARAELSRRTTRDYPRREYAVQHDETDLAFVSRLLEHEGVFHRFEHGDERSVLVLGDSAEARAAGPAEALSWHPVSTRGPDESCDPWHQPAAIHAWSCGQAVVPAEARVQDRNWRAPARDLRAAARVADRAAFGSSYQYGDVQRDADEGARYARIRAEELRSSARRFHARTNARALVAGAGFALAGHPTADGRYLAVEVHHRATQQLERGGGSELRTAYASEVVAVPWELPFRPARATPRPRIAGAIHAVIDAGGEGRYAELDEHGRYRVRLPLDLESRGAGAGSRPVRMAQPYAGEGMGLHFPLHKGAEVLLLHVNGDPDRPVIAGALANPTAPSVVTSANQTQGVLRSASGNELRFEDASGHEETLLHGARDLALVAVNDRRDRVGRDETREIDRHRHERIGGDDRIEVGKRRSLRVQGERATAIDGADELRVKGARTVTVDGALSVAIGRDCARRVDGDRRDTTKGAHGISAKRVRVEAEEELVLSAGSASITLKRDGTILIAGGDISIRAGGTLKARAQREVAIKGAKLVGN